MSTREAIEPTPPTGATLVEAQQRAGTQSNPAVGQTPAAAGTDRRRHNPQLTACALALAAAGLLGLLGVVMASNARFADSYVSDQLRQQRITFKPTAALTEEERKSPCLVRYAGQQLTTGKQAECYANDFIGLHVKQTANGQTYAELGGPERALAARVTAAEQAGDQALADLQKQLATVRAQRATLFQGETSRGLLLTTFGFSDLGAKAGQAATAAFTAASALVLLTAASLTHCALRNRARAGRTATHPGLPMQA